MTRILDRRFRSPAAEAAVARAPRKASLDGATIGLLANGKSNGMALLDRIVERLRERHRIGDVVRVAKTNASAPSSTATPRCSPGAARPSSRPSGTEGRARRAVCSTPSPSRSGGIPAAAVITEPFQSTAEAMARLAGMTGYPVAAVPHPFGSLSPAEVRARADTIVDSIERLLLER